MGEVVAASVRGPRKYIVLGGLLAIGVVWCVVRSAEASPPISRFPAGVSESIEGTTEHAAGIGVDDGSRSGQSERSQAGERLRLRLERRCVELTRDVELVRGLEFLRPVRVRLWEGAATRAQGRPLIGPLASVILRSLAGEQGCAEGGGASFFYGGTDTIWVRSAALNQVTDEILFHELAHALDDQHYQLVARYRRATTTDARVAMTAAIEGSAVACSNRYLARVGADAARARVLPDVRADDRDDNAARASASPSGSALAQYLRRLLYGNGLDWVERANESMRLAPRSTKCLLQADVGSEFGVGKGHGAEPQSSHDSLGLALTLYVAAAASRSGDRQLARVFGTDPDGPIRPSRRVRRIAEDFRGDHCRPGPADGADAAVVWTTQWRSNRAARRFEQILAPDPVERSSWSIRIECTERLVTVLIQARNACPAKGSRG